MNNQQRVTPAPNQPPLPPGWQMFLDQMGRPFYWNHFTKETSWTPPSAPTPTYNAPSTQKPFQPSSSSSYPISQPQQTQSIPLPSGWEQATDAQGRVYFVDHNTQTTHWEDPRKTMNKPTQNPPQQPQQNSGSYSSYFPTNPYSNSIAPEPYVKPNNPVYPSINPNYTPPMNVPYASTAPTPYSQNYATSPTFQQPMKQANPPQVNPVLTQPIVNQPPVLLCASKPTWDGTKEGPKCTRCGAEFTFFKRRHHCRCCLRDFCDACSTKKSNVPQFGHTTPQRVCDSCYKHLLKNETICISKLVPYLDNKRPEMEKAIRELHELACKQRKEGIIEDLLLTNILVPILELVQLPTTNPQNLTNMTPELRYLLLSVVGVGTEDANILKTLSENKTAEMFTNLLNNRNIDPTSEMKIEVIKILGRLSKFEPCRDAIRNAQGIKTLMEYIGGSPNQTLVIESVIAIHALSYNDENRRLIGESVAALIIHVSTPNEVLLTPIIGTLEQLSRRASNRPLLHTVGAIQAILALLGDPTTIVSKDLKLQISCWSILLELSGDDNACKTIATAPNGVLCLFKYLSSPEIAVQQSCMGVLLHILKIAEISKTLHDEIRYIDDGFDNLIKAVDSPNLAIQKSALEILSSFASENLNKEVIRNKFGLEVLLKTISQANENLNIAVELLAKMVTNNSDSSLYLMTIGGLTVLMDLLKSTKSELQSLALTCLNEMCQVPKVTENVLSGGESVLKLVTGLAASTVIGVSSGALQLLAVLCVNDTLRSVVFENKGVSSAVTILTNNSAPEAAAIQKSALQLIGSLCASEKLDDKIRDSMAELGAILPVVSCLSSSQTDIQDVASFALMHIARSYVNRENIMNFGALHQITELLSNGSLSHVQSKVRISEVLAAFSSDERCRPIMTEAKAIPSFIELLFSENSNLQLNAIIALSNFALDEVNILEIHKLGGVVGLIPLLSHPQENVKESTVLALGNLGRNQIARDQMVSAGILDPLLGLLQSKTKTLIDKTIWCISIVSLNAEVSNQIQSTKHGIQPIVDLLLHSPVEATRAQAIYIIMNLTHSNLTNWQTFVLLGGVASLIFLLNSHNVEAQKKSAEELFTLSTAGEYKESIITSNGIPALFGALSSESVVQEYSLGTLANLSFEEKSWEFLSFNISNIIPFISLKSSLQQFSLTILSNISKSEKYWKILVDTGSIPKLNEVLFSDQTHLAVLAATTLANMSVKTEIAEVIHSSGGVLGFITLLSQKNESLLETVTEALGNLARSSNTCRETIINNEGLDPIIPLLSINNPILQKNCVFIVGMLSSNEKFCQSIEKLGGFPPLVKLLGNSSDDLKLQVLSTFANITANGNRNRLATLHAGGLESMIVVMTTSESSVIVEKTLEVIANLSIEFSCKVAIREQNALPFLVKMLHDENHVTHALRALAHLSVDSLNRKSLFEIEIINVLLPSLESHSKKLFNHSILLLENLIRYDPAKDKFFEMGIIGTLISYLVGDLEYQQRILQTLRLLLVDGLIFCRDIRDIADKTIAVFTESNGIEVVCKLVFSQDEILQFRSLQLLQSVVLNDLARVKVITLLDPRSLEGLSKSNNSIIRDSAIQLRIMLE